MTTLPPGPRVLIADGSTHIAESLRVLLGLWGCAVETVRTPTGLRPSIRRFRPDLILIDAAWEVDGDSLRPLTDAQFIATARHPDAWAMPPTGFDGLIGKPFDPDALEQLVFAAALT